MEYFIANADSSTEIETEDGFVEAATLGLEKIIAENPECTFDVFTYVISDNSDDEIELNTCKLLANAGFHDLCEKLRTVIRLDYPELDLKYDNFP